jgi:hypothetical protein
MVISHFHGYCRRTNGEHQKQQPIQQNTADHGDHVVLEILMKKISQTQNLRCFTSVCEEKTFLLDIGEKNPGSSL